MKNIRNKISFLPQRSNTIYKVLNYVGGYALHRTTLINDPINTEIGLPVCLAICNKLEK
jgi:hypothetical protein